MIYDRAITSFMDRVGKVKDELSPTQRSFVAATLNKLRNKKKLIKTKYRYIEMVAYMNGMFIIKYDQKENRFTIARHLKI